MEIMDVLRGMRIFRSVVSLGSFAGAGRKAKTTPASISKQLTQLEEHLGTQLLNRNTHGLSLTDAGRLYLERCERVLDEIDDAEHMLGSLRTTPRGPLRISAPSTFGLLQLSPLLSAFMVKFPEIELDVVLSDREVDVVEEGFDIAIRILRKPLGDSILAVRRVGSGKRVLCAAPSYLRAHGRPTHPHELEHHFCLRYARQTPGLWEFDGPGGRTSVRARGPLLINSSIAIRDAVVSGLGIALLKDFVIQKELAENKVEVVLEDHVPSGYDVFLVSPPSPYARPKVRAFTDFLVAALDSTRQ